MISSVFRVWQIDQNKFGPKSQLSIFQVTIKLIVYIVNNVYIITLLKRVRRR